MRKGLIFIMLAFVYLLSLHTVSYAGEVVASNTPTVDAVLGVGHNKGDKSCTDDRNETSTNQSGSQDSNQETNNSTAGDTTNTTTGSTYSYNTVKPVSMAAVEQKVARKGGEALSLTQIIAYVIITILLIIALIRMAAVHSTGGTDPSLRNAGFGGVVMCMVCYVLVYAGPFILEFFKNWILS